MVLLGVASPKPQQQQQQQQPISCESVCTNSNTPNDLSQDNMTTYDAMKVMYDDDFGAECSTKEETLLVDCWNHNNNDADNNEEQSIVFLLAS